MVAIPEDDYFTGSSADTTNRLYSDTAPNNGATSILTVNAIPSPDNTHLVIGGTLYNILSRAPFSVSINPEKFYRFYDETFTFMVADFPEVTSTISPVVLEYFFEAASSGNDVILSETVLDRIFEHPGEGVD